MNLKITIQYFFVIVFAIVIAGCENWDWFRSESNLNEKIQNTWRFVPIPKPDTPAYLIEDWKFKDGILYIKKNTTGTLSYDTGRYTISTDPDDAYLDIEGINLRPDTIESNNSRWDILRLDDEVLFIVTDHYGSTPLVQREYYKIN